MKVPSETLPSINVFSHYASAIDDLSYQKLIGDNFNNKKSLIMLNPIGLKDSIITIDHMRMCL